MISYRDDSFRLNENKKWLIQKMRFPEPDKLECCFFLGVCHEEDYKCNFPEYAEACYYRLLRKYRKIEEKKLIKTEDNKNIIQKCKR